MAEEPLSAVSRDRNAVKQEARRWVLLFASGEATGADLAALTKWRRVDAGNDLAFAEAGLLWDLLGELTPLQLRKNVVPLHWTQSQALPSRISRRVLLSGGLAASLVASYAAGAKLSLLPTLEELRADKSTATGQQLRFTLDNGAAVNLNTRSSVKLAGLKSGQTQFDLISGEAAVSVGNAQSVTVVAAGGQVTGFKTTQFTVRNGSGEVVVTCLKGNVTVQCRGGNAVLSADRQVSYTPRVLTRTVPADAKVVAAWLDGLLVFRHATVEEIVSEVNRYRSGKIIVINKELGRRNLFATFRIDSLEDVVPKLVEAVGARATVLPAGLVFLS